MGECLLNPLLLLCYSSCINVMSGMIRTSWSWSWCWRNWKELLDSFDYWDRCRWLINWLKFIFRINLHCWRNLFIDPLNWFILWNNALDLSYLRRKLKRLLNWVHIFKIWLFWGTWKWPETSWRNFRRMRIN